jgi:HEPN domain-containing protein
MPRGRQTPGTPQDWLARAKSDLALALMALPEGAFYEDLCFHAQQAAEKALKAVYQHRGWSFRYTHDLEELVTGLKRHDLEIPPEVDDAAILTSFAWEARYPGFAEPITPEEYVEAVRHAEAVVSWAEKEINQK